MSDIISIVTTGTTQIAINGSVVYPPATPGETQPPVVTPPPYVPPVGTGGAEASWPVPIPGVPFPDSPISASGVMGASVQFSLNSHDHPEGLAFQLMDQFGEVEKEVCVSGARNSFVPVGGQEKAHIVGGPANQTINMRLPTSSPAGQNDVTLADRGIYYYNVRPLDPTHATTFQIMGRTRQTGGVF